MCCHGRNWNKMSSSRAVLDSATEAGPCSAMQMLDMDEKEKEMLLKPFIHGFTRELVLRTTWGANRKAADAYYFRDGHKMRSKPEVASYLSRNVHIPLSGDNFTFCKQRIASPPEEVVRQAKPSPRPSPEIKEMCRGGKRRQRSQCRLCSESPTCTQHVITKRAKAESSRKAEKRTDLGKVLVPDVSLTFCDAMVEGLSSPSSNALPGSGGPTLSHAKRDAQEVHKGSVSHGASVGRDKSEEDLCNVHCPKAQGEMPSVQCVQCLCLFHPVCVQALANVVAFTCRACQKKDAKVQSKDTCSLSKRLPNVRSVLKAKTYIRVRTVSSTRTSAPQREKLVEVPNKDSAMAVLLSMINKMNDQGRMQSALPIKDSTLVVIESPAASVQTSARQTGSLSSAMSTALHLQPRVKVEQLRPGRQSAFKSSSHLTHWQEQSSKRVDTCLPPEASIADRDPLTIDEGALSLETSPQLLKHLASASSAAVLTRTSEGRLDDSPRELEGGASSPVSLGPHSSARRGDIQMEEAGRNGVEPEEAQNVTQKARRCASSSGPKAERGRIPNRRHESAQLSGHVDGTQRHVEADGDRGKVYVVLPDKSRVNWRQGQRPTVFKRVGRREPTGCRTCTMDYWTLACRALNQVFRFLSVPSLCRAAQVCTTWNILAHQTHLWGRVDLVGIAVNDWERCTATLHRMWTHTLVVEGTMWQSLAAHVQRLNVVQNLRVHDATVSDLLIWANLFQHLSSFRASVHEPSRKRSPTEAGLEGFVRLSSLQDLVLSSSQGLRLLQPVLYPGFSFSGIRKLSLTTVVDGGCPPECFLSSMTLLQELHFGSCTCWTSQSFQALSELTQLCKLTLVGGGRVSGLSLALGKLKGLEKLKLTKWTFLENLAQSLQHLPSLKELDLAPEKPTLDGESNLNALLSCISLNTLDTFSWTVCCHVGAHEELGSIVDGLAIPFGSRWCQCPSAASPLARCCPGAEKVGSVLGSRDSNVSLTELADGLCRVLSCTDVVVQLDLAS